jgi:hypothetical protein
MVLFFGDSLAGVVAHVDRKKINNKDGYWPTDEEVQDGQRDAEQLQIFVEYVQEGVVKHDDAENEPDDPGISQWQFGLHFHDGCSWLFSGQ